MRSSCVPLRPALRIGLVTVAAGLAGCSPGPHTAVSVGTGFAALVTCSLAFVSGQDADAIARGYVADEVAPLGPLLRIERGPAHLDASALGLARARAVYREGLGCTLLPDGKPPVGPAAIALGRPRLDPAEPWPLGEAPPAEPPPAAVEAALARAFAEPDPPEADRSRRTTAIVVAHDGRLVAERYAAGYGPATPMLSWSMAKSVLATLVALAVEEGRLRLDGPAPVAEWSGPGDPRSAITLDALLRMSSGLAFDETYGPTNDVSRMLFTQRDTGAFAAAMPLAAPPDTVWSYSSGTSNLVARMLRDAFGGDVEAWVRWANERLFDRVGMSTALIQPDASGTPIGSSFVFASARDWARFGELHRRDGLWTGRRVLPEGWVRYVTTPTPSAPNGCYGAHWWLNRGEPGRWCDLWPDVPEDAYAARGHSGQYVVVVPSARLVVVRLGLSVPDDGRDGTGELLAALVRHYGAAPTAR